MEIGWSPELSPNSYDILSEMREGEAVPVHWLVMADGRRVGIGDDIVTVGRLPECAIVLTDPNASRRHAQIRRDGDAVVLVDLGSTNGTRVNGTRVREQRLTHGDTITIGTTTMRFEDS